MLNLNEIRLLMICQHCLWDLLIGPPRSTVFGSAVCFVLWSILTINTVTIHILAHIFSWFDSDTSTASLTHWHICVKVQEAKKSPSQNPDPGVQLCVRADLQSTEVTKGHQCTCVTVPLCVCMCVSLYGALCSCQYLARDGWKPTKQPPPPTPTLLYSTSKREEGACISCHPFIPPSSLLPLATAVCSSPSFIL